MFLPEDKLLYLADKVVVRYVIKGVVPRREHEDTKMLIVEKFLLKQESIIKNYSGKAKVTTYCISVLNNMCCEIIRKELKHWKNNLVEIPKSDVSNEYDTNKALIISDEIRYLNNVMILFDLDKYKINIALAYYYQLEVSTIDICKYVKIHKCQNVPTLNSIELKRKGEIFNNLAAFVCIVENKNIKSDAVRIWLNKVINTIIKRLNSPFDRANYDKDSFQILFEMYHRRRNMESSDKNKELVQC